MTISIVRLGSPRAKAEGPRLGTVRRPPRGVKKQDYSKLGYYDAWLPQLAPSAKLIKTAHVDWEKFAARYRQEMRGQEHLLAALAQLSLAADFAVGCYCEDEKRCHRSILREILAEHGARIAV
ncbi:hypothetical protein AYO46_03680 [Betaproteobacteria bacterium SCGC AG-212-J23]|nr:hypothetical protein AYO46_03680 [Betaproteobacteria bacterium SCGC AG-212-J23]